MVPQKVLERRPRQGPAEAAHVPPSKYPDQPGKRLFLHFCTTHDTLYHAAGIARISHEEHQTEWKDNTILINYTLIYLEFGIADCSSAKKMAFDVLHQRLTRAAHELRYSALEV